MQIIKCFFSGSGCACTLSNMSQIAERGWWIDAMTVCPSVASSCMCSITFSAAKLSRPGHGSLLSGSGVLTRRLSKSRSSSEHDGQWS